MLNGMLTVPVMLQCVCIISTTDAGASACGEEFMQVHLSKRQGWHDAHTSFTRSVQAHAFALRAAGEARRRGHLDDQPSVAVSSSKSLAELLAEWSPMCGARGVGFLVLPYKR